MAVLLDVKNNSYVFLYAHHSFGRLAYAVDTLISEPFISKHHSIIEWCEEAWQIRDLSSNGTWLNQTKLAKNVRSHLKLNDKIGFAEPDRVCYQVVSLDPPCDVLIPCQPSCHFIDELISLEQYHLLPNDKQPEVVMFYDNQSQQWQLEKMHLQDVELSHVTEVLKENDVIHFDGKVWQLKLSHDEVKTQQLSYQEHSISELKFIFELSQDEEVTELRLKTDEQIIDFFARSHHYLTLNLARYRLADAQKGIEEHLQGWVHPDVLVKDLGLDVSHINIQIHRARKQFADELAGFYDLDRLIERYAGKVRFGGSHFQIFKGKHLECELV